MINFSNTVFESHILEFRDGKISKKELMKDFKHLAQTCIDQFEWLDPTEDRIKKLIKDTSKYGYEKSHKWEPNKFNGEFKLIAYNLVITCMMCYARQFVRVWRIQGEIRKATKIEKR